MRFNYSNCIIPYSLYVYDLSFPLLLTFILTTYVRVIHYLIILFLFIFSYIILGLFVVNHFKSLVGKSEILINAFKTLPFFRESNIICRELSVLHQYMF